MCVSLYKRFYKWYKIEYQTYMLINPTVCKNKMYTY